MASPLLLKRSTEIRIVLKGTRPSPRTLVRVEVLHGYHLRRLKSASPSVAVPPVGGCLDLDKRICPCEPYSRDGQQPCPEPGATKICCRESSTAVHMMRRTAFFAAILTLLIGASLAWAAGNPVSVPAKYDGRWAIEATTMSGACPATLSFEMNVAKGEAIVSSSILYSVSGGISQAGAVRRTISTATTAALVTGRVEGDEVGRGTWRTQDGSLLTCGGS